MSSFERRIQALEVAIRSPWRWVWARQGETNEQVRARAGIRPTERAIIFGWRGQRSSPESRDNLKETS